MKKNIIRILLVVLVILVCVGIYFGGSYLLKDKEEKPIYTLEEFPKIDASLATQPLTDAIIKNFTGVADVNYEYTNTHPGYVRLINGEVDLIVVTEPSKEELELAKSKGVELEVIPVVKEGFVFYVNSTNKVTNLTTKQIQDIYQGKTTNWKDVGGANKTIRALQRPVNSGSQTGMLSLVMKDKKLMNPPTEDLVDTMEAIINLVSSYDNGPTSIGYSYYYYATTMFETIDKTVASKIRLLAVDGVEPNNKTIQDGTYPFTTAYYIVMNKKDALDKNSKARILADHLLSKRGQKVAEKVGYVPVK